MNLSDVYFDPYDVTIYSDPYPTYRRLREEAPLYYNDGYDFFALSRFHDVERSLVDHHTYISGRATVLEMIKGQAQFPPGTLIFEDPPVHTTRRALLSRVFTPKKMNALEPQIRAYCARCLDPLVGAGRFDFITDLGAQMPMRVIGMLLGIPEQDQEAVRIRNEESLRSQPGEPWTPPEDYYSGDIFADYVNWRAEHPSDDLMTELLQAEFDDETGTRRRLTHTEILTYLNVVAGAGNETTTRLIGWTGKILAEHPQQRREVAKDPDLIPNAIEEILRFEAPGPNIARYVARDVEFYDRPVPEGSAVLLLLGAANRDDRRFPDGDTFDIHRNHRDIGHNLTFGYGIHFCLGAALARIEGRIALEEVLKRFPDWEVDWDGAKLIPNTMVRGYETLPVFTS